MNWYEEYIEEPIRPVVRLLRDDGFNTSCSCGHAMSVECNWYTDGELKRLDDLLINNGYTDYIIDIEVRRMNGHIYTSVQIRFKDLV